jgi:hypothetical protein
MEPGQVWLMLVPCWNIIWQFVVAVRVPESLRAEFVARGRDDGSDYGKGIALASCILGLVGGACGRGLQMSDPAGQDVGAMISGVVGIVNLILFIVFWSKIASYSRQLAFDDDNRKRKWEQFDDDDDDYGRTPPKDDPPPDGIKEGDAGRYS